MEVRKVFGKTFVKLKLVYTLVKSNASLLRLYFESGKTVKRYVFILTI